MLDMDVAIYAPVNIAIGFGQLLLALERQLPELSFESHGLELHGGLLPFERLHPKILLDRVFFGLL